MRIEFEENIHTGQARLRLGQLLSALMAFSSVIGRRSSRVLSLSPVSPNRSDDLSRPRPGQGENAPRVARPVRRPIDYGASAGGSGGLYRGLVYAGVSSLVSAALALSLPKKAFHP
jgi:hypothetical protein